MSKELNTTDAAVCQLCGRPMREHGFGSECRLYVGPVDTRTSHLPDREEVAKIIDPEAFVERDRLCRLAQVNAGYSYEDAITYANSSVGIGKRITTALAKADRIFSLMERKA